MASPDPGIWLQSFSPQAPGDLIGEYRTFTPEDVAATVVAARAAQREWWSIGAAKRSAALGAGASDLRGRREEAVALIVREVGKPIGEAGGEVGPGAPTPEHPTPAPLSPPRRRARAP